MSLEWFVKVWCCDCIGEDPLGCFDGGSEIIGPFKSREEAVIACETLDGPPWDFEVYESPRSVA